MTIWSRIRSSLQVFLRRSRVESEMETELRFHMEAYVEDLVRSGVPREVAMRRARVEFGGVEQVKEECRDARGTRWLEDFFQDIRFALRMLRKNPGFTAVALLTLALGTGATTVMFTVVNGVLLKPLPYLQPENLVSIHEETEKATIYGNIWAFAYPNYVDCKRETRSFTQMAAWAYTGGTISGSGEADYVDGSEISPELFDVLGVNLFRGRKFLPEDNNPGAAPVLILGHSLWQRRFAGNPGSLGSTINFDGKAYTIVGIAPAGFRLDEQEFDVFIPLGQDTSPGLQRRDRHPGINVYARLQPGVKMAQAQMDLGVVGSRLAKQYPESNAGRSFVAEPLRADVGDARSTLWLLFGAVSLVLLIACVNVASLLLARAVSRERELAMRLALGAGRGRLVRQCLTESGVLGLSGGLLGVLLASLGIQPFLAFWPGNLPRAEEVQLDWRVLLFAVATSLLTGLLFGLAPALRVRVRDLERAIHAGARTIAGNSRRLHSAFVVSEIALAVVLLVSAGVLGRTMLSISSLDPGMNFRNVLITRMALSPATLANTAQTRAAWQDILDRARTVPGVESIALVDTVPMRDGNNQIGYSATPSLLPQDQMPVALATSVTPDYLNVMGMPLLRGRFINDQDRAGGELVVVIDDALAKNAFGAEDPVGKRLWIPGSTSPFSSGSDASDTARIIGVVGHVRHWGLAGDDQSQVRAQIYYSFAQVPDALVRRWSELMSLAVRTKVAPLSLMESLRTELRGATGDQALYQVNTMEQLVESSLARQRFLLLLFGVFAGLALLLACIGIYGVLAYLTGQRIPEFGVRIALGARACDVMWLVLRQSLGMIFLGVVIGILGAFAAGRLLESQVPGVRATGPQTFALMILLLVIAALVASFVPAHRASRVDPMRALRQE
jgi:predicted permease